jgi:hypothetical protein
VPAGLFERFSHESTCVSRGYLGPDRRECQLENTAEEHFIIDWHPDYDNVLIAGGGSGHAFKHGPVLDEYVASRTVEGATDLAFDQMVRLAPRGDIRARLPRDSPSPLAPSCRPSLLPPARASPGSRRPSPWSCSPSSRSHSVVSRATCRRNRRAWRGELWRAGTNEAPLLVYVTMEEERTRAVPIIGGSSAFRYQPYARFELVVRRIPSGEIVQVQRLADRRDYTDEQAPAILGVVGDLLWVWRDSLEGYHLPNLALQVTPSMLVPTALATREMLPVEAKGYRMAGTLGTLVARGRDARLYRIDAAPPSLATLDPSALPPTNNSTRVEDRFDYLIPPQRSWNTTSPGTVMQKSFLTRTGLWYALLSESEREGVSRWPSGEDRPFGQVARMLHRAPYTLDGRGQPEIRVDAVQPVGVERLIQAGLRDSLCGSRVGRGRSQLVAGAGQVAPRGGGAVGAAATHEGWACPLAYVDRDVDDLGVPRPRVAARLLRSHPGAFAGRPARAGRLDRRAVGSAPHPGAGDRRTCSRSASRRRRPLTRAVRPAPRAVVARA